MAVSRPDRLSDAAGHGRHRHARRARAAAWELVRTLFRPRHRRTCRPSPSAGRSGWAGWATTSGRRGGARGQAQRAGPLGGDPLPRRPSRSFACSWSCSRPAACRGLLLAGAGTPDDGRSAARRGPGRAWPRRRRCAPRPSCSTSITGPSAGPSMPSPAPATEGDGAARRRLDELTRDARAGPASDASVAGGRRRGAERRQEQPGQRPRRLPAQRGRADAGHHARRGHDAARRRRLAGGVGRHGRPARRRRGPGSSRASSRPARRRRRPTCACGCSTPRRSPAGRPA